MGKPRPQTRGMSFLKPKNEWRGELGLVPASPTPLSYHPSPPHSHAGKSCHNCHPQSRRVGPTCSWSLSMDYAPKYWLPFFFPILWLKVWSHIRFSRCFCGYKMILISNFLVNDKWVNLFLIKTRRIIHVNLIKSNLGNLELIKQNLYVKTSN